jgi:PrtD family type I secretion system ABC transporter
MADRAENEAAIASTLRSTIYSAKKTLFATVFFGFFINLSLLVSPLYTMQIYNRVLPSRSESTLVMLTGLVGLALAALAALEATRAHILIRLGGRLEHELGGRVIEAALSTTLRSGEGYQALKDFDTIRNFAWSSVPAALLDLIWAPAFVVVMFAFHPLLGLVALGGSIALLILGVVHDMATRPKLKEAAHHAYNAASFMEQSMANAQTLEAMGMRSNIQQNWLRHRNDTIRLQAKAADRTGIFAGTTKSVRFLLQAILLGCGAELVINNEITSGAIVAASMLMGRALAPMEITVGAWRQCVAARDAYARLNTLLARSPSRPRRLSLPAPRGLLEAQDVVVWLDGASAPMLRNVTFKLTPGDVLAIIGSSGSGKSTLARLIAGVATPYAGKIRIDNADIHAWNKHELGPHLGYVSQDVELFDGTVAENIARFGNLDSAKIVDAALRAGVHDMILGLPQSYETRVGPGARALSGGQRQRIALARALYGNPVLVVLDEPNSSLDSQGERALADAILHMKRSGTTIVLISHRSRILRQADHLLMLKDGTAVFLKTWQRLQVQPTYMEGAVRAQRRFAS